MRRWWLFCGRVKSSYLISKNILFGFGVYSSSTRTIYLLHFIQETLYPRCRSVLKPRQYSIVRLPLSSNPNPLEIVYWNLFGFRHLAACAVLEDKYTQGLYIVCILSEIICIWVMLITGHICAITCRNIYSYSGMYFVFCAITITITWLLNWNE